MIYRCNKNAIQSIKRKIITDRYVFYNELSFSEQL